eukprot:6200542-Pleurochrysis_carterae.AAC.3
MLRPHRFCCCDASTGLGDKGLGSDVPIACARAKLRRSTASLSFASASSSSTSSSGACCFSCAAGALSPAVGAAASSLRTRGAGSASLSLASSNANAAPAGEDAGESAWCCSGLLLSWLPMRISDATARASGFVSSSGLPTAPLAGSAAGGDGTAGAEPGEHDGEASPLSKDDAAGTLTAEVAGEAAGEETGTPEAAGAFIGKAAGAPMCEAAGAETGEMARCDATEAPADGAQPCERRTASRTPLCLSRETLPRPLDERTCEDFGGGLGGAQPLRCTASRSGKKVRAQCGHGSRDAANDASTVSLCRKPTAEDDDSIARCRQACAGRLRDLPSRSAHARSWMCREAVPNCRPQHLQLGSLGPDGTDLATTPTAEERLAARVTMSAAGALAPTSTLERRERCGEANLAASQPRRCTVSLSGKKVRPQCGHGESEAANADSAASLYSCCQPPSVLLVGTRIDNSTGGAPRSSSCLRRQAFRWISREADPN